MLHIYIICKFYGTFYGNWEIWSAQRVCKRLQCITKKFNVFKSMGEISCQYILPSLYCTKNNEITIQVSHAQEHVF